MIITQNQWDMRSMKLFNIRFSTTEKSSKISKPWTTALNHKIKENGNYVRVHHAKHQEQKNLVNNSNIYIYRAHIYIYSFGSRITLNLCFTVKSTLASLLPSLGPINLRSTQNPLQSQISIWVIKMAHWFKTLNHLLNLNYHLDVIDSTDWLKQNILDKTWSELRI